MQKINFINYQQPALNATNLNKLQQNVEDDIGDLSDLETSDRDNLVEAINEAKRSGGDAVPIHSIFDYDGDTVPTGYEEVNSYSTSEVKTGDTWIDGRPIYRKTFIVPSFSISEISVNTGLTTVSNIVNWKGCFKRADINCLYSIDNTLMDEWRFNYNTGIMIFKTNNQYVTFTGYIILEYTKTTD